MKCCGKKAKVIDSRERSGGGLKFRFRVYLCFVCKGRHATYEVDGIAFKRLLEVQKQVDSIKEKLSDVGRIMRGL
jgi:transcriptional regulator NrdR family protein